MRLHKKAGHDVSLQTCFIGLAVSSKDQERIHQLSDAALAHAYFVSTVAQLNEVRRS